MIITGFDKVLSVRLELAGPHRPFALVSARLIDISAGMSAPDLPQEYAELRRLAAAKMAGEPGGHTLDATALVHEEIIKLGGNSYTSRSANARAAAVVMSRIRVDLARAKRVGKRCDGRQADLEPDHLPAPALHDDVLAVDDALARLEVVDQQVAELVTLRDFADC